MLIWPFQKQFLFSLYLQRCELAIFNSQIKIFPLMLLMQLNFDSTLLVQHLGGNYVEGKGDILVNFYGSEFSIYTF